MKKLTNTVIILGLLAMTSYAHAAVSSTQSYRVSVTIPAIVGVNTEVQKNQPQEDTQDNNQETQFEETIRDYKVVLVKTMTLK